MPRSGVENKFALGLEEKLSSLFDLYVFIDGKFVKGEDATISVFDHGLLFGDTVFEGIRVYEGKIFKLKENS